MVAIPVLAEGVEAILFLPSCPYAPTALTEVGAGTMKGKGVSGNAAHLNKTGRLNCMSLVLC